ncbi:MAG: DUF1579 family protein [Cyclobacteriaceae bacterium]
MSTPVNDPWAEYITPSDVHALLAKYSGEFTMEITMSMGEGTEPSLIRAESENAMLLGGRFLKMNQHGTMPGMDYQAIMTMGYNNADETFALTTITNMGTGTLSLSGEWDNDTRTATLSGELTNPLSGGKIKVRQTVNFADEDTILIESYDREGDLPERKTLQYKLVRLSSEFL